MKYITSEFALNISCELNTNGDWHWGALNWNNPDIRESSESYFGDWGIELDKRIPEHEAHYNVANHIRAILDMMVDGRIGVLNGFRSDFICTDEYNAEIFSKVYELKDFEQWNDINDLMEKEYGSEWIEFTREREQV